MEKEINELKQIYLNTMPPMEATEGFADVLLRLEKSPSQKFHFSRAFMVAVFFLFATVGIAGAIFLSPPNTTLHSVKIATQKAIEQTLNLPATNFETLKNTIKRLPTSAPPLSTVTPLKSKPTTAPGIEVSEDKKKAQNPTSNDEKVKGVSDTKKPTTIPENPQNQNNSQGNSDAHRNENSNQNNNNTNPSSEKSNGKSKN